jgi:hypothetical protein
MPNRFLLFILLFILILASCWNDGDDASDNPESIVVYCDSMANRPDSWVEQLGGLAGIETSKHCAGGITLAEYPLAEQIEALGTNHKYAVLALGMNDMYHRHDLIDTLNLYEDGLLLLEAVGMEPVCFTYPQNGLFAPELNEGIRIICANRKIIGCSKQIGDYIHLTSQGQTETAVNAWRVLY